MPLPRSLSRRACNNGDQLALATPCCAAPASVLLRYIIMESSGQRIHNFGADPGAPGRLPEMGKVAEQLGAKVYAAAYTEVNFPTSHSLFGGMLNLNSAATRQQLAAADVVLAVGTNVFSSFLYVPEPFIGPSTKLIHLDSNDREVEKIYPTEVGILCDPKAGLEDLSQALDQDMSGQAKEAAATRAATLAEERSGISRSTGTGVPWPSSA